MRSFLFGLICCLVAACGTGSGVGEHVSNPVKLAKVGYGIPNFCHRVDPDDFASRLADAGIGYTVCEMQPWFETEGQRCKLGGGLSDEYFPSEMADFITAMRSRGITTLVFGINANNCKVRNEWDTQDFTRLNQAVVGLGTDMVWYLPVNEPWAMSKSVAGAWNGIARQTWTGTFLVSDKSRNHPSGQPFFAVPHDFVTTNGCSDEAVFDSLEHGGNIIATTDCSPVLNPGPERARKLTRSALDNSSLLIIYDFRGESPDQTVINVMAEEINRTHPVNGVN